MGTGCEVVEVKVETPAGYAVPGKCLINSLCDVIFIFMGISRRNSAALLVHIKNPLQNCYLCADSEQYHCGIE